MHTRIQALTAAALTALPLLLSPAPAGAQVPPATIGATHVPAPWWMREPVIASIGAVRTELPANRARFHGRFESVARTAEQATAASAARIQEIDQKLRAYGADKLRLETTFATRPLYEQYRDKEGHLHENRRPDKIESYGVDAVLQIEVRDLAALEAAYGELLRAKPTEVSNVSFFLEAGNEAKTWLFTEAVKDAADRARRAAQAAGATLAGVKVIDPTGRACETDVLAGWPRYGSGPEPRDVPYPEPAPRPAMLAAESQRQAKRAAVEDVMQQLAVTLHPPREWMQASACVVYGLKS